MSSDEEYITHDKGTLSAVDKMVVVLSTIMDQGPSKYTTVEERLVWRK